MKLSKLALFSLMLWLATLSVFAWFFVRGNTEAGNDQRTAVVLHPEERALILTEMRALLAATQGVVDGVAHNDMAAVARSARSAGMGAAADVNPALMAKLPLAFKSQGMGVHHSMDDLAAAAESGKSSSELLGMLGGTLSSCVACHAAWQLSTAEHAQ